MQAFAQSGHGVREVAHAQVGLAEVGQQRLGFPLAQAAPAFYAERASGKVRNGTSGRIEVAAGVQLLQSVGIGQAAEGAGFQQGGVRLVEPVKGNVGQGTGRSLFLPAGEGEYPVCRARSVQVGAGDGDVVRRGRAIPFQYQQQLFAFIVHGHHVRLAYVAQGVQGQRQVQHGGEFQQDMRCLVQQAVFQQGYVRLAVGQGDGASAVAVAPRGVQEEPVDLRHRLQEGGTVGTVYADVGQAQQGQVVRRQLAEDFLPFHIVCLGEQACQEGTVDAKSARQVGEMSAGTVLRGHHLCLVAGRGLGRALFQREAGRAEDAVGGGPRRDLGPEGLQAGYLGEGRGQVHAGLGTGVQGQGTHIVGGVQADKAEGLVGEVHRLFVFTMCKDRAFLENDRRAAPFFHPRADGG